MRLCVKKVADATSLLKKKEKDNASYTLSFILVLLPVFINQAFFVETLEC
jgi:hypothetical protein